MGTEVRFDVKGLIVGEWLKHDGGKCPVPPDTVVEIPAGTYYSTNGRGTLGPFVAKDLEWEDDKVRHIRDEIQAYRIIY